MHLRHLVKEKTDEPHEHSKKAILQCAKYSIVDCACFGFCSKIHAVVKSKPQN